MAGFSLQSSRFRYFFDFRQCAGAQNDICGGQNEVVLRRAAIQMIFSLDVAERCNSSGMLHFRAFALISIFVFAVATVQLATFHVPNRL